MEEKHGVCVGEKKSYYSNQDLKLHPLEIIYMRGFTSLRLAPFLKE